MIESVLTILKDYHIKTGGHCGLSAVGLIQRTGSTSEETKEALNKLYKQKKITVHENPTGLIAKFNDI